MSLVRVAMPLVRPFRTSFGVQETRDVLLVHVVADVGEGWGECAAHAEPFYNDEFTESATLMLETGVGRAANVALASLPGFTFPADISASERYWRRDITEPFMLDGSTIAVPAGPGLGVTVDRGALADLGATVRTSTIDGRTPGGTRPFQETR